MTKLFCGRGCFVFCLRTTHRAKALWSMRIFWKLIQPSPVDRPGPTEWVGVTKESSRHHSRDGESGQGGRAGRDDRVEGRMGKDELLLPLINCFVYCRFLFAGALTRARRVCSCSVESNAHRWSKYFSIKLSTSLGSLSESVRLRGACLCCERTRGSFSGGKFAGHFGWCAATPVAKWSRTPCYGASRWRMDKSPDTGWLMIMLWACGRTKPYISDKWPLQTLRGILNYLLFKGLTTFW